MKKTIMKGLSALCTGAIMLCASSSLFVSCDKYDDSALKGEIENIKGDLSDLEKRIAALEADYQKQVEAMSAIAALQDAVKLLGSAADVKKNADDIAALLQTIAAVTGGSEMSIKDIEAVLEGLKAGDKTLEEAIDALGLGVIGYKTDEATGKTTITLSDGSTLEVVAVDKEVSLAAVKVKKDADDKYYWAVNDEFLLDADGAKIPVSAVVPQVKIDPQTRKVCISVDGGETWVETENVVDEAVPSLFKKVEAKDGYLSFVLANGEEFKVAISSDAADMIFELNKMYFPAGATQTVQIGMENVTKYVIVKPEGWRVSVNDVTDEPAEGEGEEGDDEPEVLSRAAVLDGKTVLSITAPAKGVGEKSGLVSFFCVGADGRAAIYEVEVSTVDFTVAFHDHALGSTYDVKVDDKDVTYITGVAVLSQTTTLKSIYDEAVKDLSKYEVHTGSKTGLPLTEALDIEALEYGKEYTAWVIILGDKDNKKTAPYESMVSQSYKKVIDLVVSDIKHNDATVEYKAASDAGDYYYYMAGLGDNVANFGADELQQKITAAINSATSTSNLMSEGKYKAANGSFLKWYQGYSGSTSAKLVVGQTVFVAFMPKDNKDADHVIYELVTLKDYAIDENSAVSVTIDYDAAAQTTTKVKATITPAQGTSFYRNTVTEDEYEDLEGDYTALMKKAVGKLTVSSKPKTANDNFSKSCGPGETYYLIVYAFDDATGTGKIFEKKLESPKVAYNEKITLSLDVTYTGVNYVEATIAATGGSIASIRYGYMKKSDFDAKAELMANGKELEQMLAVAENHLSVDKTISKRGNFNTANLAADNKYTIENLYFMEEQYLFVIAFDAAGLPTRMKYELVDTKKALDRFSTTLVKPTVKEVYYYVGPSNSGASAGYAHQLSEWSKMSDVTDVTTLDNSNGVYWLDLDWNATGETVKRMWLSADNKNNWNATYPLTGTDMKADAASVIKNRAGYQGSGNAPDFYGRNTTTGALTLDPATVKVSNTSIARSLRDKTVTPIAPKTIHFVWETTDGDYGYMTVVPEEFAGKTPEEPETPENPDTPDTPAGDLASSPWGEVYVWQKTGMPENMFYVLDLAKTAAGKIQLGQGQVNDAGTALECSGTALSVSGTPEVKTDAAGDKYVEVNEEYRVYWSAGSAANEFVIWSPSGNSAYEGLGVEDKTTMKSATAMGLPAVTWSAGGPSAGTL